MKKAYLLFVMIAPLIFIGCKKDDQFNSVLKSYSDSMGVMNFSYSNKKVSSIFTSTGRKYGSFEHKENYVKAFFQNIEVEYFLNNSSLPVRIVRSYQGGQSDEVNYFYKNGTNILDSVINSGGSNGSIRDKFTFVYNGENIEKVIVRSNFRYEPFVSESVFNYTYFSVPNVFRKSDPLLFIYTNPLSSFGYHSFLFYFPKTFSAYTFSGFSHPDYGGMRVGSLNYSTNRDGKILKESYGRSAHRHEYSYNR